MSSSKPESSFNKKPQNTYLQAQSTKQQTGLQSTLSTPDPYANEATILKIRIECMQNMHSLLKSLDYESLRFNNQFEQPYYFRRNNRFSNYQTEKFAETTKRNISAGSTYAFKNFTSPDLSFVSAFSVEKMAQKKNKQMRNNINDFNYNFIKHSFKHYFEQYINLVIMVEQQIQSQDECEFETSVPKRDMYGIEKEYFKEDLVYPPPYSQKDFKYDSTKIMFKLNDIRKKDPYKTCKMKSLIFPKLTIINLINLFSKTLTKLIANNVEKKKFKNEVLNTLTEIRGDQDSQHFYETQNLLYKYSTMVYEEAIQTLMKQEKNSKIQIKNFCKQKLKKFIEWITIFNLIITIYGHFKRKQPPISYYCKIFSLSHQHSTRQRKSIFFLSTLHNPTILCRVLSDAISEDNQTPFIISCLKKHPLSILTFHKQIYTIGEEEDSINYLSKYMIHYLQYCIEVAGVMTDTNSLSLDTAYNSIRFILMFFFAVFIKKTLGRIQREILFCHGDYVATKVKQSKENLRFQESYNRLEKYIKNSYTKIAQYISDMKNPQKSSVNIAKIKAYNQSDPLIGSSQPNILKFIETLNKQNELQTTHEPLKELELMIIIFKYIIRLMSTQYLNKKNLERCFKKIIDKNFKDKVIAFDDFLNGKSIDFRNTKFQDFSQFQKSMKTFEKQFKMAQIEMMQNYIISMTIWCYSFAVQEEAQKIRNKKTAPTSEQNQKLLQEMCPKKFLINLDLAYIMDYAKINPSSLKECSITRIDQLLKRFTKFCLLLNEHFKRIGQNKQFEPSKMKIALRPERQTVKQVQVPVHDGSMKYSEEQELQNEKKRCQLNIKKDWSNYSQVSFENETKLMDLNKLVDRRIHKGRLSIFGLEDSWKIGRAIYEDFFKSANPIMASQRLKDNLKLTYSYRDDKEKVYQSQSLVSTKTSSKNSSNPQSTKSK